MVTKHIYSQFDDEMESIRSKVVEMGTIVEEQLVEAVQSLVETDVKLAKQVITKDESINDLEMAIDEECSLLISKRSPVAADLRNVLMVLRIIGDLERIGDESTKIANATIRIIEKDLMSKPKFKTIKSMLSSVQSMLHKSLNAFARLDTTEVIDVLQQDKEVDEEYRGHMRQLLTYMLEDPRTISISLELMFATKALERIGDHTKNISQSVTYIVKGTDVRHASIKEIKAELKH